ncbi:SGNH/GDSL hydrolase family protein [Nocardioides dongxiaopingii]|uniref:SGNH/GDSL hydrolase family protein n=1 Tax=Nocardioides sp. S-1144 TaxID=2582905 RepID=UPI00110D48CF|nr:SGNH/GDSL hydrolase family protein [Nocardioides sp. S-1144]QCW52128.1 SGNH/GDSL hydrolase family protein [Nocardioides sp. S-1144]
MRRLVPLLLAGTLAVGVSGCSGGTDTTPPPEPTSTSGPASEGAGADAVSYVALGDSYAAAPGVPNTSGADGCFRSDQNYAHLLAAADETIALTDVTCSGATTDTLLAQQVPALDAGTDLVTLGIGGNDFELFLTLISQCSGFGPDAPGTPCTEAVEARSEQLLPKIEKNIGATLDAVQEAAPDARVIVVGYPALLPRRGTCPELVPLAAGDYPFLNEVTQGLSDALRSQAEERDLDFVDVARASRGHDICSDDPWVNGAETAADGTIPFHPFAAEQAAVADLIAALR